MAKSDPVHPAAGILNQTLEISPDPVTITGTESQSCRSRPFIPLNRAMRSREQERSRTWRMKSVATRESRGPR